MKNALRLPLILLASIVFLVAGSNSASAQDDDPTIVVRAFSDAFNAHDVDAMIALVSDDFAWLAIAGDSVTVEARGPEQLRAGMGGYFAGIPSVRSEMGDMTVTGSFVSFTERVFWDGPEGEQTQASLAVYEVADGRIQRAWYYPSIP